jgi:hypothetical protein
MRRSSASAPQRAGAISTPVCVKRYPFERQFS